MTYDFSNAEPNTFEVIPDGTTAPLLIKFINGDPSDDLHATKDGSGRFAKLEVVVTEGQYAKRKFFLQYMLASTRKGADAEGHIKAIDISRSSLRSIVEAARGFAPTDESDKAVAARKLKAISDLDGMEFTGVIGIEKGTGGYQDRNTLKRVVPVGKAGEKKFDAAKEAASMRASAPAAKQGW